VIGRAEAIELARAEVERQGLGWDEPVRVHFGFWNYSVWTNSMSRGGNLIIEVNRRSRIVTVHGPTPK
jgi:hypothetical protein